MKIIIILALIALIVYAGVLGWLFRRVVEDIGYLLEKGRKRAKKENNKE